MRAPDFTAPVPPAAASASGKPPPTRDRFAREIATVLVVKAIAIVILWLAFFSAPPAPSGYLDPQRVAEHIAAPPAPTAYARP